MQLPDQNNIGTFLENQFATTVPDQPTVISFATSGYESVLNNGVFQPIKDTRTLFDGQYVDESLAQIIAKMADLKNQVGYIARVYDTYDWAQANDPKFMSN